MYGLPHNFDGAFLVGHVVEMICFAKNAIYMHFGSNLTIRIESTISYKTDICISLPLISSDIIELIGCTTTEVQVEDGTLRISFSNGNSMFIYDSNTRYESYIISIGSQEIVV